GGRPAGRVSSRRAHYPGPRPTRNFTGLVDSSWGGAPFKSSVAIVLGFIGGLGLSTYLVLAWLDEFLCGRGRVGGGGERGCGGWGREKSGAGDSPRPPNPTSEHGNQSPPSMADRRAAYERGIEDRNTPWWYYVLVLPAALKFLFSYRGQLKTDYERGLRGRQF